MFVVEYIHNTKRQQGVDEDDLPWVRMVERYTTEAAANDQRDWLALDEDGFSYRTVPVANDQGAE